MCSAIVTGRNGRRTAVRLATIGAALVMAAQLTARGPVRAEAAPLPSGMLAAIGRVESVGRGSMAGTDQGWPWTVDSLGQGRRFPTKSEAAAHVQGLLLSGICSIDVGCFQVNLQWHPAVFASLEEAFEPGANARYAAFFLVSLRGDEPCWSGAIARYHSRTGAL